MKLVKPCLHNKLQLLATKECMQRKDLSYACKGIVLKIVLKEHIISELLGKSYWHNTATHAIVSYSV